MDEPNQVGNGGRSPKTEVKDANDGTGSQFLEGKQCGLWEDDKNLPGARFKYVGEKKWVLRRKFSDVGRKKVRQEGAAQHGRADKQMLGE